MARDVSTVRRPKNLVERSLTGNSVSSMGVRALD